MADVPIKLLVAICFNLILYFLGGLRMESGPFFVFFLFSLVINFTMSFVFKTIGALTQSVSQAMTAAGVLVPAIIIYTGFTIPRPDMRPWFQWLSWINPVAFAFEALNDSFRRKTGYVQQQDLHLETTSVREALHCSALLRQPASIPKSRKSTMPKGSSRCSI